MNKSPSDALRKSQALRFRISVFEIFGSPPTSCRHDQKTGLQQHLLSREARDFAPIRCSAQATCCANTKRCQRCLRAQIREHETLACALVLETAHDDTPNLSS